MRPEEYLKILASHKEKKLSAFNELIAAIKFATDAAMPYKSSEGIYLTFFRSDLLRKFRDLQCEENIVDQLTAKMHGFNSDELWP